MSEAALKLQKFLFPISIALAVFLGFSLAYLSGNILPFFFSEKVAPPPASRVSPGGKGSTVKKFIPFDEFKNIAAGNLIRGPELSLEPGVSERKGQVDSGQEVHTATANFMLMGTISGPRSIARAAIKLDGERKVKIYKISDSPGGYKILKISWDSILVRSGSRKMKILIGKKTTGPVNKRGGPRTSRLPAGPGQKAAISRTRLKGLIKKGITKGISASVFKYRGKVRGLKIISIRPNHVFYELGARTGDLIRTFNGKELNNQNMLEIYGALQSPDLKEANIVVERGGKLLTFTFIVQD